MRLFNDIPYGVRCELYRNWEGVVNYYTIKDDINNKDDTNSYRPMQYELKMAGVAGLEPTDVRIKT